MMDQGGLDAVLIATPHYFHPVYAIEEVDAFHRRLVEINKTYGITREAHYENVRNRHRQLDEKK